MAEKLSWNVGVTVAGGPQMKVAGVLVAEAYDKLVVAVPDDNTPVQVDVQPSDDVVLLAIQSTVYADADLTYSVDGAGGVNDVVLDGPQVLIGTGMVSLLGTSPKSITFTNNQAANLDATVTLLVGRKAT